MYGGLAISPRTSSKSSKKKCFLKKKRSVVFDSGENIQSDFQKRTLTTFIIQNLPKKAERLTN